MMRRAIEVGRAVLSLPGTNQELWLTTLITLSQPKQLTNFEQHSVDALLSRLSSGDIWVNHGRDLHVEFGLTHRKEPLASQLLETFISNILSAPAWGQLNLQPSWISGPECELGKARINLSRSLDDGPAQTKKLHRVFSNVPVADVRPPDGIPHLSLDSVQIQMDILDTGRQAKGTSSKRPKTSLEKSELPTAHIRRLDRAMRQDTKASLHSLVTNTHPVSRESAANHLPKMQDAGQKRKRAPTSNTLTPFLAVSESIDVQKVSNVTYPPSLERLIDGALRLAIYGGLNKSTNGIKVKASSIDSGLTELIPELWSPGFLPSISARAHLLPVIGHSLSNSAGKRATSLSLKEKWCALEAISLREAFRDCTYQTSTPETDGVRMTSPIACRLWLHLRRNLCKTTSPLLSFVVPDSQPTELLCSDESTRKYAGQEGECDGVLSSHEVHEDVYQTKHFWVTPSDTEDDLLLGTDPQSIKDDLHRTAYQYVSPDDVVTCTL